MQDPAPPACRQADPASAGNGGGIARIARRGLLGLTAGLCSLAVFGAAPAMAAARASVPAAGPRRLFLVRPQAGESFKGVYHADGRYIPEAVAQVGRLLRDQNDDTYRIDPRLIDVMARMQRTLGTTEPLQVVSGYRSPRSNALARSTDRRVARNSFHMEGKAVDIRVAGFRLSQLRRAGLSLQAGGVGTYPRRDFLHLDVGPVRSWG